MESGLSAIPHINVPWYLNVEWCRWGHHLTGFFLSPFLALPSSVCSDSNPAVTGGLINWKGVGKDWITQRFSFTSRMGYLCALWKCPSQEEGFRSVSRKFLFGLYNGYHFLPPVGTVGRGGVPSASTPLFSVRVC